MSQHHVPAQPLCFIKYNYCKLVRSLAHVSEAQICLCKYVYTACINEPGFLFFFFFSPGKKEVKSISKNLSSPSARAGFCLR